jgi:uncharacterized protein YfiM (DUF2279 family)
MNDQTPFRLDAACGTAPARLQDAAMLFRRRAVMAGLVCATLAALAYALALVLGADGWSWPDIAIFAAFFVARRGP